MITLTTRPQGGVGFQLFVDGKKAGGMEPGILYNGALPIAHLSSCLEAVFAFINEDEIGLKVKRACWKTRE